MKELLFGWIIKGQYEISFLDSIIAIIEIFGTAFILLSIAAFIHDFIEKFRNKGE